MMKGWYYSPGITLVTLLEIVGGFRHGHMDWFSWLLKLLLLLLLVILLLPFLILFLILLLLFCLLSTWLKEHLSNGLIGEVLIGEVGLGGRIVSVGGQGVVSHGRSRSKSRGRSKRMSRRRINGMSMSWCRSRSRSRTKIRTKSRSSSSSTYNITWLILSIIKWTRFYWYCVWLKKQFSTTITLTEQTSTSKWNFTFHKPLKTNAVNAVKLLIIYKLTFLKTRNRSY